MRVYLKRLIEFFFQVRRLLSQNTLHSTIETFVKLNFTRLRNREIIPFRRNCHKIRKPEFGTMYAVFGSLEFIAAGNSESKIDYIDLNWQKLTEINENWPKLTKIDRNRQRLTEINKDWPKSTKNDRNRQRLTEIDKDWPKSTKKWPKSKENDQIRQKLTEID